MLYKEMMVMMIM